MKLDKQKWNNIRKELEQKIKEYKVRKRESLQPRWKHGIDDWEMVNMKFDATTLYAVRAAVRNKQHCEKWPVQDAIDKILPQYMAPAEEEKPVDSVVPEKV